MWRHQKSRSVWVKQALNTCRWLVNVLVTWHVSYKITTLPLSSDGSTLRLWCPVDWGGPIFSLDRSLSCLSFSLLDPDVRSRDLLSRFSFSSLRSSEVDSLLDFDVDFSRLWLRLVESLKYINIYTLEFRQNDTVHLFFFKNFFNQGSKWFCTTIRTWWLPKTSKKPPESHQVYMVVQKRKLKPHKLLF